MASLAWILAGRTPLAPVNCGDVRMLGRSWQARAHGLYPRPPEAGVVVTALLMPYGKGDIALWHCHIAAPLLKWDYDSCPITP